MCQAWCDHNQVLLEDAEFLIGERSLKPEVPSDSLNSFPDGGVACWLTLQDTLVSLGCSGDSEVVVRAVRASVKMSPPLSHGRPPLCSAGASRRAGCAGASKGAGIGLCAFACFGFFGFCGGCCALACAPCTPCSGLAGECFELAEGHDPLL